MEFILSDGEGNIIQDNIVNDFIQELRTYVNVVPSKAGEKFECNGFVTDDTKKKD
jgi:uncharacterized protein YktA (UPF0223 family)